MTERYEQLIDENTQLKRALISSKSVIDRISNDYETLKSIHEDDRIQFEKIKKENQEYLIRNQQLLSDKRELEQQFDTTIRNLKMAIEQKQREIEEIQQRVIPSFDQDMLRIRIINELEIPHRQQLESKQTEIDKLSEQIYQLKRQVDIQDARVEAIQLETQREIRATHEKFQLEAQEYSNQINELTRIIEDNKDREQLRRLKKEFDELKSRYNVFLSENEDLRNERDQARSDRNDVLLKFSRQIDQERSEKRQYKSESEKLVIRLRFLEDEIRKEKIRRETLLSDVEVMKSDKEILQAEMRKKDDSIHYLQRKITELEEERLATEQKNHEAMLKQYQEEHDKYLQERNKAVTVQKDFDSLKKRFSDLQDDYKFLKEKYGKEVGELKEERRSEAEDKEKLKRALNNLQKEHSEIDRQLKMKEDQIKDVEQECEILRKRLRASTTGGEAINQRIQSQNNQQTTSDFKSEARSTKVRFNENENQNQDNMRLNRLQQENQELMNQIDKLTNINKKLKEKLKQANEKIMDLLKQKLQEKQGGAGDTSGYPSQGYPSSYQTQQQRSISPNLRGDQLRPPMTLPGQLDLDDEQILNQVKMLTTQTDKAGKWI